MTMNRKLISRTRRKKLELIGYLILFVDIWGTLYLIVASNLSLCLKYSYYDSERSSKIIVIKAQY